MAHLNGVGATSACLREAASAKAGRPLEREAKASPTQRPRKSEALLPPKTLIQNNYLSILRILGRVGLVRLS